MKNTIYLRRKHKILLESGASALPLNFLASFLKNIESLGFTLSQDVIAKLTTFTGEDVAAFYRQLVADLQSMVGANVRYNPMYPNFPNQVMAMDEAQLYLNAMFHYLGDWLGMRILPDTHKDERASLSDHINLQVIELGTEADFQHICRNLLRAKTSLSETDKQDIAWFIQAYRDQIAALLPDEIPHKENLAYVTSLLLQHTEQAEHLLATHFKTATDVLRLATALSDGDISLAANTKFRNFTRQERRLFLGLLEQCEEITEDMLRHKKRWIRLGERLHPFEYSARYPKTAAAFDVLRNNKPFSTFNSRIEHALLHHEIFAAAELLQTRPGEFARRLDHLLRLSTDAQRILSEFEAVAEKIATPLLLQVFAHFQHRNQDRELRTFFPKGNVAKVQAIQNTLPHLDQQICDALAAICTNTLMTRFQALPPLGKTYLDPRLHDFLAPFSQRSASKSLRTIVRGSRLPIPEGSTIRFFLWWKEGEVNGVPTGRVDIDLSAVMYDAEWRYKEHISYTNLKSAHYRAVHSGDITSAPYGACEFIDLDIESVIKHHGRYVVMSLNSFTDQPYCNLPECYAVG